MRRGPHTKRHLAAAWGPTTVASASSGQADPVLDDVLERVRPVRVDNVPAAISVWQLLRHGERSSEEGGGSGEKDDSSSEETDDTQ